MNDLTREEREWAFRKAMGGFALRYMKPAMTDEELAEALALALGIFGGSGGPGELSIMCQGGRPENLGGPPPLPSGSTTSRCFEARETVAMAREIYGITDSADTQLSLL